MKEYNPENWRKFAIEKLKEMIAEGKYANICVSYISSSYREEDIGKIEHLQVCEYPTTTDKDFNRWMERIQIQPRERVKYFKDDTLQEFRDIKDVANDLEKVNSCIAICVSIVKMIDDTTYIVKLFDKYFMLKTNYNLKYKYNKKYKHAWFSVACDEMDKATFTEIDDENELMQVILKYGL